MSIKRIFITGASSGIGAALARRYADQGAMLGLVARRGDELHALRAMLPNSAQHQVYPLDVTDHAALALAAADFMATGPVDVVIANAGISAGTLTALTQDLPVFERIVAVNVTATIATFAPFIAPMQRQSSSQACHASTPRLVGIASVAGIRGLPGAAAYSASKAAVINYCEALRIELRASGIQVVTIVPGFIDTPMTQGNPYPMPFLMPVEKFAVAALAAIEAGVSYRVIPWQMGWVAKLMRVMPNWLYDWVLAKAPRKPRQIID